MEDWKLFYAAQSEVTGPAEYRELYGFPSGDISSLCTIIQGLIVHLFWAPALGLNLAEERKNEVTLRKTTRQIARILELADLPLATPRPLEKRLVGTCRDYAVFLISMLRQRGIPARLRAGFAPYLKPGRFEEHYLCQYWNAAQARWVLVDAQLDEVQRRAYKIDFDPCDLPAEQYCLAGRAWQLSRRGQVDPEMFGIQDFRGLWFTGGALIHDLLALNKIESQPWDIWPLMPYERQSEFQPDYLAMLDHIAGLCAGMEPDFGEVRSFYLAQPNLQPPPGWKA